MSYRVIVLYEQSPDAGPYEEHAEVCRRVPNAVFRHGRVLGAPMGEAPYTYYAEWEMPDEDAFKSATRSEEFMATAKDARDRGFPQPKVFFAEVS